ncbi:Cyclic nucleotide-binding domain-containing protein [Mariprofundus ferrinatatus]|uniref:Cyclic nucleotide-binding domain-containing protein n=1 Tax=Mariprofundus ferrinatatus TaxID=1921087 RepID=A0A2K8L171_9PROT|nr:cyclic nucleotide-binding domain-containing protein [Mariprofundus ferrinatatus]ATX81060.1 Cyclic nucleotide-binding domain-containing protein [Mariprofundus ferrinatatus]
MTRTVSFNKGESLIKQGDHGTTAYLIQSGWVLIEQKKEGGTIFQTKIGTGEIIGELALAGLVTQRSASATAITDVTAEIIDRGALIRMVNGPANKLTPILAAFLSRLKSTMVDEKDALKNSAGERPHALVVGLNSISRQALCNLPCTISHLPWTLGAHVPPQSVTDLFRTACEADIQLTKANRRIREHHISIEAGEQASLQLRLMQHGDYCEVNEKRVGYGASSSIEPLPTGYHMIRFGDPIDPYEFGIEVLE